VSVPLTPFSSLFVDVLLPAASKFYSRVGRWAEAAVVQRRLVVAAPRDAKALAALVVIESHFDPEKVCIIIYIYSFIHVYI